jgi:methylenetetrahydrofolate reductase (NADPH)
VASIPFEATFDLCEQLAQRDLRVFPHIAARLVRDRGHLAELVARAKDLGVEGVFVIAGDAKEPAGPYEGAVALLREMDALGHHFSSVGVTGYPESHAFIPDADLIQAMSDKAPFATHIVSQMCYDPAEIAAWVAVVRRRGIHLPIYVGIPGAVDRAKLARISLKVGLGDSVRFLRKQTSVVSRLVSGYTPDDLVQGLGPVVAEEGNGVIGWHLFTFNDVAKTEQWRQGLLTTIRGATA